MNSKLEARARVTKSAKKMSEERQRQELEQVVAQQYPRGDQNITTTIKNIMQLKTQRREPQTFWFIESKPTVGYVTTKDLINLERLKSELFPAYDELEAKLQQMKDVNWDW